MTDHKIDYWLQGDDWLSLHWPTQQVDVYTDQQVDCKLNWAQVDDWLSFVNTWLQVKLRLMTDYNVDDLHWPTKLTTTNWWLMILTSIDLHRVD